MNCCNCSASKQAWTGFLQITDNVSEFFSQGVFMAKVLVTGAGGFIGSHLTEELVRQGEEVRAFVRYNSRDDRGLLDDLPEKVRKEIEVFPGDLKDPDAVKKAIKGCSRVFHLGALIAIPYSYAHPFDFIQTNVIGT